MTLHYEDAGLRLWHGPNMEILPTFADETFDSIVTDPPYELGFMGKGWDSSGIAYDVNVWAECLRVLKPGGHLLAFGGSRTWHRMAVAIEDAGFEMRDSIAWLYGSGFPKSLDVAKALDKIAGYWRGRAGEPTSTNGSMTGANYTRTDKGEAVTDAAKEWEGWGTALKPAFEPIVVARKPLRGTVAANMLAHGTGALNIDANRTGTEVLGPVTRGVSRVGTFEGADGNVTAERVGRWPTNVLLDGSQADELDAQSGLSRSRIGKPRAGAPGEGWRMTNTGSEYDDQGGASRFFPTFRYEAKAPASERPNVEGTVHATVKPLALIRWLVRLVTRPGGRVLDLYAGSGTTGEAALLEGMEVDLIELEEAHLPLILARVRKPLHVGLFPGWEDAS